MNFSGVLESFLDTQKWHIGTCGSPPCFLSNLGSDCHSNSTSLHPQQQRQASSLCTSSPDQSSPVRFTFYFLEPKDAECKGEYFLPRISSFENCLLSSLVHLLIELFDFGSGI